MGKQELSLYRLDYTPSKTEGQAILNSIYPVYFSKCKLTLFIILSIILGGIPLLILFWYPNLKRPFFYSYCSLQEGTHVAVVNYDEDTSICQVSEEVVYFNQNEKGSYKAFINRYIKYIIKDGRVQTHLFDYKLRIMNIVSQEPIGLTFIQAEQLRKCYGLGTMITQRPSMLSILIKDLLRPLYLFLFFNVSIFIYLKYYYFPGIILFGVIVAIILNLVQTYQLKNKIFDMAYYKVDVDVLREGQVCKISSIDVVPGDIVFLKKAIKIPFEGIILEGSALINECALTGQSVPILKKAGLMKDYKNQKETIDRSAQIYEGTHIIQVNSKKHMAMFQSFRQKYGIPVCVTRTNFVTSKGQLIRMILFPKEQYNTFQKDSVKFLCILFIIALATFFGILDRSLQIYKAKDIFIQVCTLIGVTVPPALPVSMAIGIVYAVEKLKKKSIFCIDNSRIITGGVVDLSCFDKTGTLTQDFMDFQCLVPAHNGIFYPRVYNHPHNKPNISAMIDKEKFFEGILYNMASNHSVVKLDETGELIGDPMEIKLIQFGEFSINQSSSDHQIIFSFDSSRNQRGQAYKIFEFDSEVQRMSTICKIAGKSQPQYHLFSKGSPQIMLTIMDRSSVPMNYQQVLKEYTSNGFRVLAIASKKLEGNFKNLVREQIETSLFFNGFQVFQNKLKPETNGAIKQLKDAKIGVVMITGDNPLTGSNIGYKCNIAHHQQGMIICDYIEGQFYEQKFIYRQKNNLQIYNQFNQLDQKQQQIQNVEENATPFTEILIKTNKSHLQIEKESPSDRRYETSNESKIQNYIEDLLKMLKYTNNQLCITGNAFNKLFEGPVTNISPIKQSLLESTTIFARTKPNDKAKIVMVYQNSGRTVSMCGDGANDCGALKQADIGLSLSQAQASISAPFTSQITNITSMIELIKQCRAGLATNFSIFNIMASYSLISYTNATICFLYYAVPPDLQYLYWDLFCNFTFISVIGYTQTADKLSIEKPSNSLFSLTNVSQVLIIFGVQVVGQISMILALQGQFNADVDYNNTGGKQNNGYASFLLQDFLRNSPEINILFPLVNFLILSTMLTFTIGEPWRKPFYTNILYVLILIFDIIYSILIAIYPEARLIDFKLIYLTSQRLNGFILGVSLGFFLFIIALHRGLMSPVSLWLRKKYSHLKWL